MTEDYIRLCCGGEPEPWILKWTPYWISYPQSWYDHPLAKKRKAIY